MKALLLEILISILITF